MSNDMPSETLLENITQKTCGETCGETCRETCRETGDETETTSSNISVCDEIQTLIDNLEINNQLHETAITSLLLLHNLIKKNEAIYMNYNNTLTDLDDILEELHQKALSEIEAGNPSTFGQNLVDILRQDFIYL
jgi:hypothetical protein